MEYAKTLGNTSDLYGVSNVNTNTSDKSTCQCLIIDVEVLLHIVDGVPILLPWTDHISSQKFNSCTSVPP